jgi:hypothetical protein
MTIRTKTQHRDEGEGKPLIQNKGIFNVHYTLNMEQSVIRHPGVGVAPGKQSGTGTLTVHDPDRYKNLNLTFPIGAELIIESGLKIAISLEADGSFQLNGRQVSS